jgi:predicted nucleic acid-binding protein
MPPPSPPLIAPCLKVIALDTNILARLLLRDDEEQYQRAKALLGDDREYTAPPTVILELVWVLGTYGINRTAIANGLKALLGLTNFKPTPIPAILSAIALYERGLDFADALHLSLSQESDALMTFDRGFASRARETGAAPTVELA